MVEDVVSPACHWLKQAISRSLKTGWGHAFSKDLRHCKGSGLKDNLCAASCRNQKFLGVQSIGNFLAQHKFWTIIAWPACTYLCTVYMCSEKLVVNWTLGLKWCL